MPFRVIRLYDIKNEQWENSAAHVGTVSQTVRSGNGPYKEKYHARPTLLTVFPITQSDHPKMRTAFLSSRIYGALNRAGTQSQSLVFAGIILLVEGVVFPLFGERGLRIFLFLFSLRPEVLALSRRVFSWRNL